MDYPVEDNGLFKLSEHDKEVMKHDSEILHLSFVDVEDVKNYLGSLNDSTVFKLQDSYVPKAAKEKEGDYPGDKTR